MWKADRLTIVGTGPTVVIEDKTCNGKGLFVVRGNDITIMNLTLSGAQASTLNSSGIRAEGANLKVEGVRILNSQDGILAASVRGSVIEINNSEFVDDGNCITHLACGHGVYVGEIETLRITNSKFFELTKAIIKSRALRTEIVGNSIHDGDEGTSSYSVDVSNGGSLVLLHNSIEKGPLSANKNAAVVIGVEGVSKQTRDLLIESNEFINDNNAATFFGKNMTTTPATLIANDFKGEAKALSDGQVR